MKTEKTPRGFDHIEFTDLYGETCSLQKSSLATEDAIWFGIDDPKPMVMAKDAARLGVPTSKTTGWVPYHIPKEVLITTRMHLTQDTAAELIPLLQKFVDTGDITDRLIGGRSWVFKKLRQLCNLPPC